MLKLCKINVCPNGTLGLHLSRAPWDPYPWVSGVSEGSSAYLSGIRIGDTILEYNGLDVLGWKILELANKIHSYFDCGGKLVNFLIWRSKLEQNQHHPNDAGPNINQQSLQKFATCLQNIAQLLECPVCLEVVKPPGWQCCNGHVICNGCRCRTIKCPICRVPLGPRGRCLLSDKLFTLLAESFPCDGVRNDNKNGRCPADNHKIISKTSSSVIETAENNFLMDKTTSENICCNSICSGQRIRIKTNPKDDEKINKKQIINIKVKSPQILSVPVGSDSTEPKYSPSVITILNNTISSSSCGTMPLILNCLDTNSVCNTTTTSSPLNLNQQNLTEDFSIKYKNYHCPTGKSCNFQENDENSKMYNTNNNFSLTIINTETLNINNNNNSQNINQNIQWDILTHLRRVHQLFICQYYGIFGEYYQIDLFKQNKSIFCISIDTKFSKTTQIQNNIISNIDNQIENSLKYKHRKLQTDSLYLTERNFNSISNDTFISNLLNSDSNDDSASDVTSINSVNSIYKDSINKQNIKYSDTELFFIGKIPIADETSKIILNLSDINAPTNNIKNISRKSSLTNDNNIFDAVGFNVIDINKSIEKFSINTSKHKNCTTITINDTISSSDLVTACEILPKSSNLTSGYKGKCAIFIWYCGNECNVKNFKAFIKCNGKMEQTTMAIHSITKSWDIIRYHREFLEINIDNDDSIFEIIIDSI